MGNAMVALKARLADLYNLGMASAVLGWDQRVFMPAGGAESRARQLATLAKLHHEMGVSRETQDLLAAAEAEGAGGGDGASDDAALLRVARRDLDKAIKVPTSLVVEMTEVCSLAEEIWVKARAENDYASFAPWLERIVGLKRQYAAAIGYQKRIYNALLDDFEEGMTADVLDPLFEELKQAAVELAGAIRAKGQRGRDKILKRACEEAKQEVFSRKVVADCGFDFSRGRLDRTVHPFCTNFSPNDVRITMRYDKNWLPGALFGCLHEMGHAFYEMNIKAEYEGTPLAGGVSLGVHESQSRLWENMVGRSRGFWEHYYPELQRTFPRAFKDVSVDKFYQAINAVAPSLIRVEADEVTYNLHIILRYEMETQLLEGKLSVADAPAAWNAKMKAYLGIEVPSDREGILQDVHWSGGGIGYFPTYSLGNILATQFFEAAVRAKPEIPTDIAGGKFGGLFAWLKENVHQYGRKYPPAELVKRATGETLTTRPYAAYLKRKFGEVYGL